MRRKGKPKKAEAPTPEYDSVRETGILLETIRKEISLVAEQHGTIIKKLENHDQSFEKINTRLERVEDHITGNSYKIDRVEQKLDTSIKQNETRLKKIESKTNK